MGSCRILSIHRGCPNIIHETQIEAADLSTPSFPTPNWQSQVKIVIVADFGKDRLQVLGGKLGGGLSKLRLSFGEGAYNADGMVLVY